MQPSTLRRSHRAVALGAVVAVLLAACGGGDDAADEPEADEPAERAADEPAEPAAIEATDGEAADSADDVTEGGETPADDTGFEPGPVSYRVVNLAERPVDLYVRTQGLVHAYTAELGVQPGAATELFAPPTDGAFVVLEAGADDPECVASCPHILASLTAFDTDGPVHTVVLYDDAGQVRAFDLWEDPLEESSNSNSMAAADPSTGLFVVTAIGLTDADFGLRLGYGGGCVEPMNLSNILVGGTQTPAFAYDGGSVDVLLYDNQDRECTLDPVGGPFTITGGPGSRTHLVLSGSPGAMDAVVLPFVSSSVADVSTDDADSAAGTDRDTAIALMTDELVAELELAEADAACIAPYMIDAIGVDAALPGGELIDLDAADEATQNAAYEGIFAGVDACGVDPASLGG